MIKRLLLLGIVVSMLFLSSCIENRKIMMLQKNDVNKKHLPIDTVLRHYEVAGFNYKLQTNDILSVRFESLSPKEYDFFTSQQGAQMNFIGNPLLMGELVDEEGKIVYPFVGKVKVAGLTVFQAQDTLQKIATQYLESPVVKVRLLNYRITMLGEMNKEGTVTLNNNRVTMLEAIALGGGLGEIADRSDIKLIRQIGGKTEVAYINVLDENFINSPYYYVYQNDVLVVPALRQRAYRKYFGTNMALFVSVLSLYLLVLNYINQ